jgi:hypothetical protein
MITNKVTFAALAAMAVVLSVAMLVSSVAAPVAAKIECENRGGQTPEGQQGKDKCRGPALENKNPAGKEPGGWAD